MAATVTDGVEGTNDAVDGLSDVGDTGFEMGMGMSGTTSAVRGDPGPLGVTE